MPMKRCHDKPAATDANHPFAVQEPAFPAPARGASVLVVVQGARVSTHAMVHGGMAVLGAAALWSENRVRPLKVVGGHMGPVASPGRK